VQQLAGGRGLGRNGDQLLHRLPQVLVPSRNP
jgi:hypothetical protein